MKPAATPSYNGAGVPTVRKSCALRIASVQIHLHPVPLGVLPAHGSPQALHSPSDCVLVDVCTDRRRRCLCEDLGSAEIGEARGRIDCVVFVGASGHCTNDRFGETVGSDGSAHWPAIRILGWSAVIAAAATGAASVYPGVQCLTRYAES